MSSDGSLHMFTIYANPADYPGLFVVRESLIGPGIVTQRQGEPHALALSLDEARAAVPWGLVCLTRAPEDDPCIVETWF